MKTVSQGLRRARAFIAKGFCKHHLAINNDGVEVDPRSPAAVAWCVYGALDAAGADDTADGWLQAVVPYSGSLVAYNNHPRRTQKQMLRLFDQALALAAEKGTPR